MPRRKRKAKRTTRTAHGRGQGRTRLHSGPRAQVSRHSAKDGRLIGDPRIEAAILDMNRGLSLTAAARTAHISSRRLRRFLVRLRLGKRKGRRWVTKDDRLRRVLLMTGGRPRAVVVRGYERARLVGEHHYAAREFVSKNDIELLKPFKGRTVRAANGRLYPLETDPNAVHRIAAMDSPPFHEIYEITSNT